MSAWDSFTSFTASMNEREKSAWESRLNTMRSDLLAARSEDARVRLVTDFVKEVREIVTQGKK